MNPRRLVFGVTGIGLLSAALLAGGAVESRVPAGDAIAVLGNDYYLVVVLGVLALVATVAVLEHGSGVEQSAMPDPEGAVSVPTPGDELTDTLDGWVIAVPFLGRRERRDVRSRLRETAVAVVRRTENCTAAEARARVEAGAWTDNPATAAFLASDWDELLWTSRDGPAVASIRDGPQLGARVLAIATGDTWFASQARRAADEIASRARIGSDEPPEARDGAAVGSVSRTTPAGGANDEIGDRRAAG